MWMQNSMLKELYKWFEVENKLFIKGTSYFAVNKLNSEKIFSLQQQKETEW
jgi:hypothetical protein